jgi:hypothetical protein
VSEISPSILWTALPMEMVLDGMDQPPISVVELAVGDRLLQVTPRSDGWGMVQRLVSSRAEDYLDPRWQPGAMVHLTGLHT